MSIKHKVFGAARNGKRDILERALSEGFDINTTICGDAHQSLLHYSVDYGHEELVLFLVEKGIDVNGADKYGRTALHRAANRGDLRVVDFLVERGAHVDQRDTDKMTPFNEAVYSYQMECAQLLLERGADIENRYNSPYKKGLTSLFFAVGGEYIHSKELIDTLVDMGARSDVIDDMGCSLLGEAIKQDNLTAIVVQAAVDINIQDSDGKTALHHAVAKDSIRPLYTLLKRSDLDFSKEDKWGNRPLFYSTNNIVTALLNQSAPFRKSG